MTEAAVGPGVAWGWPVRRWALLACGLHVVAGLLLYEPVLFPGGDNAGYMILGEALRGGEGYRDLYLPGTPVHTKYPPLYPAVLGTLGLVGGLQLFKLASLAFTTGAVALTALLGSRWLGPAVGVLAALVLALNPVLLDYSHYVLSEAPFLFLVLLSLWAAVRWHDATEASPGDDDPGGSGRAAPGTTGGGAGGGPWLSLFLAGAAGAFLTRTAGLPLLAAAVAYPALRRRWRATAGAAGVAAVAAGGWALFQRLAAPEEAGYLGELLMVDPYDPAAGTVGVAGLVERTARNVWSYLVDVLPGALTGGAGEGALAGVLGLSAAALALWGWLERGTRGLGPGEVFLLLYAATISAWPSVWTDQRFLLPVLPLVLLYGLHGAGGAAAWAARRLAPGGDGAAAKEARPPSGARGRGGRARAAAAMAAAVAVALPGVASAAATAPERVRCLGRYRAGSPCDPPAYASFYDAARWAREHTPADAVVVNRKPRLFYWVGRRRGDVYPFSREPAVVLAAMEEMGADYVVVDAVSGTTGRYLVPALEAHMARFEVAYRSGTPPTFLLRFLPGPGQALGPPGTGPGPGGSALARGSR